MLNSLIRQIPVKARAAARLFFYEFRLMIRMCSIFFRPYAGKGKANPRRVILLAWTFPPIIFGGTYRPATLARTAWCSGWQLAVFCGPSSDPPPKAGIDLLSKFPDSAEIYRTSQARARGGRSIFFPRIDGGSFRLVFETFLDVIANTAHMPPTRVMASGPPFHNFVVATLVARYFRSALVLEYRDEWTECPFTFVRTGPFDRLMERWCLRFADRVVLTTDSQREHLLRVFPNLSPSKCVVIPNGYDEEDLPLTASPGMSTRVEFDPFVLSYLGYLGAHTAPDSFLHTVATVVERDPDLLRRLRLEFIGTRSETAIRAIESFPFPGIVAQRDLVPKYMAMQSMMSAGALLLLNPGPLQRYLPGKLYDYVASGTPILVYGAGGEVERLITELGAGIVVPENDPEGLRAALHALERTAPSNNGMREEWLHKHTRARLSEVTLRLLEEVESASP